MNVNTLPISEQFLSFQGEGPFAGHRAIFLRTHACNLLCGGGKYKDAATWTCDTIPVFTKIQNRVTPQELLIEWQKLGWITALQSGAHLVITGGEPLMPERQEALVPFLALLGQDIFIEVETNGTITPAPNFDHHISHYNCSPKLSNSGMPRDMRLVPSVVSWHCNSPKSIFKFVISSSKDVDELLHDFIIPLHIPSHKVWLMPAASSRDQLAEIGPTVAALALQHDWNYSNRLHIQLYDQVTGV